MRLANPEQARKKKRLRNKQNGRPVGADLLNKTCSGRSCSGTNAQPSGALHVTPNKTQPARSGHCEIGALVNPVFHILSPEEIAASFPASASYPLFFPLFVPQTFPFISSLTEICPCFFGGVLCEALTWFLSLSDFAATFPPNTCASRLIQTSTFVHPFPSHLICL